jgi:hypothetical protein
MSERTFKIFNALPTGILVTAVTDATGTSLQVIPITDEELGDDAEGEEDDCDGNCEGCSCGHDQEDGEGAGYDQDEAFIQPLEPTQFIDVILDHGDIAGWPGGPGLIKFIDCQFDEFGYRVSLTEQQEDGVMQLVIQSAICA